jgi:isopentenyldiphosphate isomerase
LHRYDDDVRDRHDYEFVESYRLDDFAGDVKIDPHEVAEFKYTTLEELKRLYEHEPETLTPWLRSELAMFTQDGFETIRTTRVPT